MFDLVPLTGTVGAEIVNLDLNDRWSNALIPQMQQAISDHKVVVIRNESPLSPARLAEFARQFGTPEVRDHPEWAGVDGLPEVKIILSDGDKQITRSGVIHSMRNYDAWHTDGSVRSDTNNWLSFLYAEQIPDYGRDTLFADMEEAYDRLSEPMKQFIDNLTAVHAWPGPTRGAEGFDPIVHPVVLVDPATGRRSLYVNQLYTTRIVELNPDESELLLRFLCDRTHRPEVQVRVNWKPRSLTIWDNRRTQHYPVADQPGERVMHRVMVSPEL